MLSRSSRLRLLAALSATILSTVALLTPAHATEVSAHARASASSASVGTYENAAQAVTYSGAWKTLNSRSDSGGSSRYLNSNGSATFAFTGTAVQWVSRATTSAGIAEVYLDGKKVATVDRYSAAEAYQKVVFEKTGLPATAHTLKVVWSGRSNSKSSGKNLLIDSFIVPDVVAPDRPSALTAASSSTGSAGLTWKSSPSAEVVGYRVYVLSADDRTVVGATDRSATRFTAVGLPADTTMTFAVSAIDAAGNESAPSTSATLKSGTTPVGDYRYSSCPTATKTVTNADALMSAVRAAKPGSVIRLAPGTYRDQINLTAKGTADKPIWVCGPRSAVIDTGTVRDNHGIMISNSSNLIVTGMTVRNALKGITMRASSSVTVSDARIDTIGYEGVHLRENTTDSFVVSNIISKTGTLDPFFGEGVYVGSSEANWCELTACQPDRSDRNAIVGNSIFKTGSDPIEVKEGTSGGVIKGNALNGTNAMPKAEAWVKVKGNGWTVTGNSGSASTENGFRLQGSSKGWGLDNVFSDNRAEVGAPGYGFSLYEPNGDGTSRTIVSCDNVVTQAASGFTTAPCTP